jgi:hypothetical protein
MTTGAKLAVTSGSFLEVLHWRLSREPRICPAGSGMSRATEMRILGRKSVSRLEPLLREVSKRSLLQGGTDERQSGPALHFF